MLGHPRGLEHSTEEIGKVRVIPTKIPVRNLLRFGLYKHRIKSNAIFGEEYLPVVTKPTSVPLSLGGAQYAYNA